MIFFLDFLNHAATNFLAQATTQVFTRNKLYSSNGRARPVGKAPGMRKRGYLVVSRAAKATQRGRTISSFRGPAKSGKRSKLQAARVSWTIAMRLAFANERHEDVRTSNTTQKDSTAVEVNRDLQRTRFFWPAYLLPTPETTRGQALGFLQKPRYPPFRFIRQALDPVHM